MKIDISNGYVEIKDFYPYGVRKKVKNAMFKSATIDIGDKSNTDGKIGISNIKMADMQESKQIAVLGMLEKIFINEKDMPINESTLDTLSADDYDKIESEVDKITSTSEVGLVKS